MAAYARTDEELGLTDEYAERLPLILELALAIAA